MSSFPFVLIANDEKNTYAYCINRDWSRRGVAICANNDKPNPVVGAIIALCKALDVKPTDACLDVLRAYAVETVEIKRKKLGRKAPPQVQVIKRPDRVEPKPGELIGLIDVKRGHVELELDPALDIDLRSMGRVGSSTPFKDCEGKRLHVGDLVMIEVQEGTTRAGKTWKGLEGLHFVVNEDSDFEDSRGAYIMGLCEGCNRKTGEIDGSFRVRLAKTWKEVQLGEEHDLVRTVWKGAAS